LQLCTSTLRGKSTNDEVAEVSRGLKALALEMRIAVIVLSQLNRAVEARADREPQLSDLRDSGAIEQDLDVAALLWTAREDDSSDGDRLVGVKVAKHRGGRKGTFALRWRPAVNQWRESDESLRGSAGRTDQRPARGFK
jgi:replicative DNA helicase